ncbi:MAG: hypothetical protein ACLU4N_05405 [Butyricimonas faecihominis]
MNLEGGKPYRYMLKTFYGLRNACYISLIYDELTDRGYATIAVKLINEQKYDEAFEDV